ncbi:MAG TPA: GMC family oxidoreductase [Usitatibacter sp.]|nr:GMC family oxidoreductase [Usitatibacter sp.]
MGIADPIQEGLARGWKVIDAAAMERDAELEFDVVVVGSGAGGGVTAEILAEAGLDVALVEEGPLASSGEFRMREREAYPRLYQESAGRQTRDKAITILQGRCVGGSTTVNWTSSFRTPEATLRQWREAHGLRQASAASLDPWFRRMEERLAIAPWDVAPNENNDALRRGCDKLGLAFGAIPRNVKGCLNIGYCGTGCPTNAKQSMLVTTIPAALDRGATLVQRGRAMRLEMGNDRVHACEVRGVAASGAAPGERRLRLRARHFVLAAGAIGSPAILMRSHAPDPHFVAGRRTFLHPTVVSAAILPQVVDGFHGAPQSIYSDHFLDRAAPDGPVGFKLESAPTYPLLVSITLPGFGADHARWMARLRHAQVVIALLRDGFHDGSPGGRVLLRGDGSAVLDYPMTRYLWEGVRRAYLAMAEIQFAAGATEVMPVHEAAMPARSWREARALIEALPMRALAARVMSAHVMGGCAMGVEPRRSVVNEAGRHHQLGNLSVHDGSLFPTSVGANPQLSIYAQAARLSAALAADLRPR